MGHAAATLWQKASALDTTTGFTQQAERVSQIVNVVLWG